MPKFRVILSVLNSSVTITPLPKQKYGFDMANYGPYMARIWVRYGMVRTLYGKYMVPKFVKFQAMGSTWD